jgi:mRNA-degrading endonuclease RelE of RelBE toxin-antitoxin system
MRDGETYRIRVGSYRVIYTVADKERVVDVAYVRHRRDAYRRR